MPRIRRVKRPRFGRRYKRRVTRIGAPISRSKIVKFKLGEYASKASTSGAIAYNTYPLMDLIDPTGGHGTQQPLYFDQMAALYHKAIVIGYKVMVRFHNTGSVASMVGITAMPENQGSTALTDYEHYLETRGTKSRLLSPDVDHTTLVYKVNTRKHHHLKSLKDEAEYHNIISGSPTSPTKGAFIHIWSQPTDRTTTNSVEFVITIEQLVLLFDPIIPTRS